MRSVLSALWRNLSMYRLVTLSLIVLVDYALVLALLGVLYFDPLAMVLSLLVLVIASYTANVVFASLFRVQPNNESSVITALLLFFLLFPTSEPSGLGVMALVAVVANASKYLIAYRGRHILNPAAFGIAMVTLTGLTSAAWWVGTPAMLIPVLVLGALVLARLRLLAMGVVFVAFTSALYALNLARLGVSFGDGLWLSVSSYPIVFLVGFMVSEPLTSANGRWQQWAVAAIVGILTAFPFTIGSVLVSPDFALLVGNMVAFILTGGGGQRLTLVSRRALTPTTAEYLFTTPRPVDFGPGQYLELTLPGPSDWRGRRRAFSITSVPGVAEVTIAVKHPERPSRFKRSLATLEPGDRVQSTRAMGRFALPRDAAAPLLLVAGGIGITPFVSQLEALRRAGEQRDVILIMVLANETELAFPDVQASRIIAVSPSGIALPGGWEYRSAGRLSAAALAELVPDVASRACYVSGSPDFVSSVSGALRSAGVRRVHRDAFFGY